MSEWKWSHSNSIIKDIHMNKKKYTHLSINIKNIWDKWKTLYTLSVL